MAEKTKKSRKPTPLSLSSQQTSDTTDSPNEFPSVASSAEIESLTKAIQKLELTPEQKVEMDRFMMEKKGIIVHGEFKDSQFDRLAELGYGNGGVVLQVQHKPTGIVMARKMIMLDIKPSVRSQIMRELKVLHECNSPYIVGFFGSFNINNEISILMQHMDGGSLDLILNGGRIPVEMIGKITISVLQGLHYLREEHKIIHRDVKPSNVLVNSRGEIKLCDFGVSGQLINSMANSFVGTRSYMAPERLQGEVYSVLSDIWSLGVSLIEMAIGSYPIPMPPPEQVAEEMKLPPAGTFPARDESNPHASHASAVRMPIFELLQIIFTSEPPQLPAEYFPESFQNFVEKCLQKESKKRGDLKTLLTHVFVKEAEATVVDFASWVQRTITINASYLPKQKPPPTQS